jgi:hypothetical protein
MKTKLLITTIAIIGVSLVALTFVYQHVQNCEAQGGFLTGILTCDKSQYYAINELFQKKFTTTRSTITDMANGATQEMISYDVNGNSMTLLIKENRDGPYYAEITCKYNFGKTKKITKDLELFLQNDGCFSDENLDTKISG